MKLRMLVTILVGVAGLGAISHCADESIPTDEVDGGGDTDSGDSDSDDAAFELKGEFVWAKLYENMVLSDGAAWDDGSYVLAGENYDVATLGSGEPNETTFTDDGLFIAKFNADSTLAWAKQIETSRNPFGIATHSDGSVLVAGYFLHAATFGRGEPREVTLTVPEQASWDMFVAKYKADGSFDWAIRGGVVDEYDTAAEGNHIAVLGDGSAAVTGMFKGTVVFGAGESNETRATTVFVPEDSEYIEEIFVARYDSQGRLLWVRTAGDPEPINSWTHPLAGGIGVLDDGSAIVAGQYEVMMRFSDSNDTVDLFSLGAKDIFVVKFSESGDLIWVRQTLSRYSFASPEGLSLFSDGSAVVTGWFDHETTFGPGEFNETTLIAATEYDFDIYTARYQPNGDLQWAKAATGVTDQLIDIADDVMAWPDGSSLITGIVHSDVTFGAGEPNETVVGIDRASAFFLASYAQDGALKWVVKGDSDDSCRGWELVEQKGGGVLVLGSMIGECTFAPGQDGETTVSTVQKKAFIAYFK